jgi:hypothetical protein
MTGNTSRKTATALTTTPTGSSRTATGDFDSSIAARPTRKTTTPTGRLMRKTDRQPSERMFASISTPAISGALRPFHSSVAGLAVATVASWWVSHGSP